MWIKRDISDYLKKISHQKPSIILTGCRQAGKTSILKEAFGMANYVSLDIPLEAAHAEDAGDDFLKKYSPPVIIDEVQYAPQILRFIKSAIDKKRDVNGQFFLTGSQKFELMEKVTESLAGRCAVLDCHSLSGSEYERWSGKSLEHELLWRWIWMGGYPEIHAKSLDPQQFYGDYLVTYLERDVRQVLQVKNLRDFDRFLRLCAIRTGQLLSYNSIATDIGVSPHTVQSWLSVLESSNIVMLLEPYYQNLGKRIIKTPKLYFLDTGLASYLAGFKTENDLKTSQLSGAFFETHVLGQIIRYFSNRGERTPVYFYRDHYGHEVDFVIAVGNALKLIECKLNPSHPKDVKGFSEIISLIGEERVVSRTLISTQYQRQSFGEKGAINNSIHLSDVLNSP